MNVKKLIGRRAREKLKIGGARMENSVNRKEEEKENRKREGVKKMRVKRKRRGEEQM